MSSRGCVIILLKVLSYAKSYKWLVFLIICFSAGYSLMQSYFPYVNKILIDDIFGKQQYSLLLQVLIMVILAALFSVFFSIFKEVWIYRLAEKVAIDLKKDVITHMRKLEFAYFEKNDSGRLLSIFQSDVPLVINIYKMIFPAVILSVIQVIISSTILAYMNVKLMLIGLGFIPVSLAITYLLSRPIKNISTRIQSLSADFSGKIKESLSATKEITTFSQEKWDIHRLHQLFKQALPLQTRHALLRSSSMNGSYFVYWTTFAILFWFGGRSVQQGEMTIGALVAFVTYVMNLFGPILQLFYMNTQLQTSLGGAKRIFALLDQPVAETYRLKEQRKQEKPCAYAPIHFENVMLQYDKEPVLKHVNLTIREGETVAFVGGSGAGKTSLIRLISGLYLPTSGRVEIGGVNIKHLDLPQLRQQMAAVFQDSFLFSGSIKENIRFGNQYASDEQVIQAAAWAQADEYIQRLPEKYDTMIGENGVRLSGGQKQRLALARAFIRNPKILILDEATSALDYRLEQSIAASVYHQQAKDRITIIVAHRMESIKYADRIFVLKEGSVVESGSHHELLGYQGEYAKIYAAR